MKAERVGSQISCGPDRGVQHGWVPHFPLLGQGGPRGTWSPAAGSSVSPEGALNFFFFFFWLWEGESKTCHLDLALAHGGNKDGVKMRLMPITFCMSLVPW